MSAEKSWGIVLRVVDFSETSKVVTLFTRDHGKITGLAKGAYRRNGPFDSALDLLSIVQVTYIHKSGNALDLLTEAKLERRFRSASRSLTRLNCAFYLIEILGRFTEDADPNPALFDLAVNTLQTLDGDRDDPQLTLAQFEMQMLAMLGHAPMLSQCVSCGKEAGQAQRKFFGTLSGGLLCSTCRVGKKSVITLSPAAWSLLDALAVEEAERGERMAETAVTYRSDHERAEGFPEVRSVLNLFISHLLGQPPRLQANLSKSEN